MKTCLKCKIEKNISLFYKNQNTCKQCHIEYVNKYKKSNFEKVKKWKRKYYIEHRSELNDLQKRFKQWHRGAIRRNIAWDISIEDVLKLPMICFYTGQNLTFEPLSDNTVSLDRLDSTGGYVEGNIVLCCANVNMMKNILTHDKFVSICKLIYLYNEKTKITS